MRLKRVAILSGIASAALFSISCRRVDDVVWSKYVEIPSEGWDPINVIPFFPWPEDSITSPSDTYSLTLSVRYSPLHRPAPLHLIVRREADEMPETTDTFRIEMPAPTISPTGRGCYGIFETVDTLFRNIKLQPGMCVELQSLSVTDNSKGITDIGLILSHEK